MADYRFARRPRWLATHLFVLAVVVLMVALGFWQLRRLDERRDRNDLVEARSELRATPVEDLVDPGDDADDLRFRRVVASGEYDDDASVSVRANQDGAPGAWVLTPMQLDGGEDVVVLRGFVRSNPSGDFAAPAPPSGEVVVEGIVVPLDRTQATVRSAVERLERDTLLPVLVQAQSSDPPDDASLEPVPPLDLDEGPHLGYAVQWFLFAAVVVVGYPFLLRRTATREPEPD